MNRVSSIAAVIPTAPPNCPICHDDLYRPENPEFAGRYVATARPCGHKFHFKCLDRWRKDHLECPYGRRAIEDMLLENRTLPGGWQQQMTNAAKQGDIGIIRVLLNLGADVDAGQSPGKTPLALAATNKHLDVALLLADRGGADLVGLRELGRLYRFGGEGVPVDLRKAECWLLRAAVLGDASAMCLLAHLYHHGGEGFGVDLRKAEYWYREAAGRGIVLAMSNLGYLYQYGGEGFEADPDRGTFLLFKAAGLGSVGAMYNLGNLYHHGGVGFKIDLRKAEHWYLHAIKRRCSAAMNNLAVLYLRGGKDFPANPHKGKRLLLKAAGLGDAVAMYCLGQLYEYGRTDFPTDHGKAQSWYQKAAELGNARAMKKLEELSKPQPAKKRGFDEAFPDEPGHAHPQEP
ncbi:RING finger domain-containing protein [Endozoicomonas sp. ALC013]|uniref:RING finger domain-containing protein n=1 Tax=Endozoicomonas sp. ALC013 TaxID=3403076 RepID=UPI003BB7F2EB